MTETTLLFTDIVDSTAQVERLGDQRAAALWAEHDRCARELLAQHNGREIDRSDGFFLVFDQTIAAARFALAYHEACATLGVQARVGLHRAGVTLRHNPSADVARGAKPIEVEGLAKPFAARLMALAAGGQTLLSAAVRTALVAALPEGCAIEAHGHYRLKGVAEPAEVFELGRAAASSFAPPPDSPKAYRVVRIGDLWRPLRDVPHNLAPERDAFVGRSNELRALAEKLDAGSRLLTVLGPGGVGKTRFVRRYGVAWLGDWPGGVHFCDLSEARSLDGVHFAVALALGVPLGRDDPTVQLGHAIAARGRCLVILDNFEQVLEHAGATLGRWLDRAGEASFVVTSRERLQLAGEEIFAIESLRLQDDAIELFTVRARAQRPDFVLADANRAAVAEVVRLLDGLPLAIELAAARTRILAPHQLVARMQDRFALLAGSRGAAARQATLKAAIDWSWDLLVSWEQSALAQCSVFEGGFTLEAAEAVLDLTRWPDAPPALDVVQSLVDKSLLRTWVPAARGRLDLAEPFFGMYLSIHDYAAEKLRASDGETASAAHRRHGRYFASLGTAEAIGALSTHGGVKRRRLLALEIDNLMAACRRALSLDDGEVAVATYRAAWEVLELQGPLKLGVELGRQVLALANLESRSRAAALATQGRASRRAALNDESLRCLEMALGLAISLPDRRLEGRVLNDLGELNRELGRMEQALALLADAVALDREVGDRRAEGGALSNLAIVHHKLGRVTQAREWLEAALAIHREVGDRINEGIALGELAILHTELGSYDGAFEFYRQALAIHREVGNRSAEGVALGNLGNLLIERGRLDEAVAHQQASLVIHREVGGRRFEAFVLSNLASLQREQGRFDEAVATSETALAIAREVGNRPLEGSILGALGLLQRDQGRPQEALLHFAQGLDILRAVGDRRVEGCVQACVGELLCQQGRIEEGHAAFRAGEVLLRDVGERVELGKLLCMRGGVHARAGEPEAARGALSEAQATLAAIGAGPESELARSIDGLRALLA